MSICPCGFKGEVYGAILTLRLRRLRAHTVNTNGLVAGEATIVKLKTLEKESDWSLFWTFQLYDCGFDRHQNIGIYCMGAPTVQS